MALLRRSLVLLALLLLALPVAAQEGSSPGPLEYELKAAFLFNFVKFVEWPADAFAGAKSPLTICVYGADPFGASLDGAVRGESLGERGLLVQRPESLDDLRDCQVLFVSRSERARMPEVLARVQGAPVLTVGDTDGFLKAGGVINFVVEHNKVRFLINQEAAGRSQLKISSKLLRLAVQEPGKGP
ncbi:MAG: YfiR family protein [Acidobacteriota bacterium]